MRQLVYGGHATEHVTYIARTLGGKWVMVVDEERGEQYDDIFQMSVTQPEVYDSLLEYVLMSIW